MTSHQLTCCFVIIDCFVQHRLELAPLNGRRVAHVERRHGVDPEHGQAGLDAGEDRRGSSCAVRNLEVRVVRLGTVVAHVITKIQPLST